MTVSSSAPTTLLDSVLSAQAAQEDAGVAVLKKAQDSAKQQGEALVQMLEQIGTSNQGRLDAYA